MEEPILINEIIDDRYKIIEKAGSGGMANVFRAHDLITDKDVAIKMLKLAMSQDKVSLTRFEREARAAASLSHQNIVKVVNVGSYSGMPFMVNEYVDGKDLRKVLDVRGKFSFLEACDIMYQLTSAINYAHSHGVIHRDVKPQNIMLTKDGLIKLTDFGIATFQNSLHITMNESVVGSIQYMAPELLCNKQASFKSDIYAAGITFFELITGVVPFDNENNNVIANEIITSHFPSIRKYNSKTPECIENIIYKACQKNPDDRYQSAEAMKKDIENILKNQSLLEKTKTSFFDLFKPNSLAAKKRREEKKQKKLLKKASKEAKKERDNIDEK